MLYSEWVQSTEDYKGFTLQVIMSRSDYDKCPHRCCRISKNGKGLGIAKTKKELKDLIDHGIYDRVYA